MLRNFLLPALLVLFPLAAQAQSQFQVLHAFGAGDDGGGLWSSVVFDQRGNLYGTTSGGGIYGQGIVFELTPGQDGEWTETVPHSFPSSPDDGQGPLGGVILDTAGNLYGATEGGGTKHFGLIYELTPGPNGWGELTLYNIGTNPKDNGTGEYGGLARDATGSLYGTTVNGGGAVFELMLGANGDWNERVLHTFLRPDGYDPYAGMILDPNGNLYGTTQYGGRYNDGIVYELQSVPESVSGPWREHILHAFGGFRSDGVTPSLGALAIDHLGNLYGTTEIGGQTGYGTVFKLMRILAAPGGEWAETILYNFPLGGENGDEPGGSVILDKAGNLYGTTIAGGSVGCGVVFELAPQPDGSWQFTLLHSFTGFDGCEPDANLTLGPDGNLYGTTATGGEYGGGTVFEITLE